MDWGSSSVVVDDWLNALHISRSHNEGDSFVTFLINRIESFECRFIFCLYCAIFEAYMVPRSVGVWLGIILIDVADDNWELGFIHSFNKEVKNLEGHYQSLKVETKVSLCCRRMQGCQQMVIGDASHITFVKQSIYALEKGQRLKKKSPMKL